MPAFLRRHPILITLALLLCAATGAFALFLSSFDLNNYRNELQTTLSQTLNRPVQLGRIAFSLRSGLSLSIAQVKIGDSAGDLEIEMERLALRLRLAPLLRRQLSFSSIILDTPHIRLHPDKTPPAEAEPEVPLLERLDRALEQLERLQVDTLILRNGTVGVVRGKESWGMENVDLQLRNIALGGPINVTAGGQVLTGSGKTPWRLSGIVEPPGTGEKWTATRLNLEAAFDGLGADTFADLAGADLTESLRITGTCDLVARFDGAPAFGLDFSLKASGHDFALQLPGLFRAPIPVHDAHLGGVWQHGTPGTIRNLLLRVDGLTLLGEATLPTAANPLSATLQLTSTPLLSVGRFVPDRILPEVAQLLRRETTAGTVAIDAFRLHWDEAGGPVLDSARFSLQGGRVDAGRIGIVDNLRLDLRWQDQTFTVSDAGARLLGGEMRAGGTIGLPAKGHPLFKLTLDGTTRARELIAALPAPWSGRLAGQGTIALKGEIGGSGDRLLLDMVAKFSGTDLSFDKTVLKPAGSPGELLLLGAVTRQELELSHARLLLPFADVRANGRIGLDDRGAYDLACEIRDIQLERLPAFLPVQKELDARGSAALRLDLDGDKSGLRDLQGSGEFSRLGLHLWNAVADIRNASGRMELDRNGIRFPAVTGLVGLSPVRAVGDLKWTPGFQLVLDVDLVNPRAGDLVFTTFRKNFEQISGRLIISEERIVFDRIQARLDATTSALVSGRVDYEPTLVDLDISAAQANVAAIIGLWQEGPEGGHAEPDADDGDVAVTIRADVAEGDLYGLGFQDAKGVISVRDNRLIIHPMQLKIGSGSASVQIVTGPLDAEYPLLKVAGRADRVEVAKTLRELSNRDSDLRGNLTADFFVQGELGRYLPTCTGGINLRVEKGVLYGVPGIARALALFNVSRILSFKLPDIGKDGLLFDRMTGSVTIRDGQLRTEDLYIKSPAFDMALFGTDDLVRDKIDMTLGVRPLQSVDKVVSSIPLAGWILTGDQKALVTAQFRITGKGSDPKVEAVPISSLSEMGVGILKRTFGLPGKLIDDVKGLFKSE